MRFAAFFLLIACAWAFPQFNGAGSRGAWSMNTTGMKKPTSYAEVAPLVENVGYSNAIPVTDTSGDIYTLSPGLIQNVLGAYTSAGTEKWTKTNTAFKGGKLVVGGGHLVMVTQSHIYIMSAATGAAVHTIPHAATLGAPLLVDYHGTYYLALQNQKSITVYNVGTGSEVFNKPVTGTLSAETPPVLAGSYELHVVSYSGSTAYVYGIRVYSGSIEFKYTQPVHTPMKYRQLFVSGAGHGHFGYQASSGACFIGAWSHKGHQLWNSTKLCPGYASAITTQHYNMFAIEAGSTRSLVLVNSNTGDIVKTLGQYALANSPMVYDEGQGILYYVATTKRGAHNLRGVNLLGKETTYLPVDDLARKTSHTLGHSQELRPVGLNMDGTLIAYLNTGKGGSFQPEAEDLVIRVGNHFASPEVNAYFYWGAGGVTACVRPEYNPAHQTGFNFTLAVHKGIAGTYKNIVSRALYPTIYERTQVAQCLQAKLTAGVWSARVEVDGTAKSANNKAYQYYRVTAGASRPTPTCPSNYFLGRPSETGGYGVLSTIQESWISALHPPTKVPTVPANNHMLRWRLDGLNCAVNSLKPGIHGGLLLQVDSTNFKYEGTVLGRTVRAKSRLQIDYDGDGNWDQTYYYPDKTHPGQPIYLFANEYSQFHDYTLYHDDPIEFRFPNPSKTFTDGSIVLSTWLTDLPAGSNVTVNAASSRSVEHFSRDSPRGPSPYDSKIILPFEDRSTEPPPCAEVCPDAFYFDSYWSPY